MTTILINNSNATPQASKSPPSGQTYAQRTIHNGSSAVNSIRDTSTSSSSSHLTSSTSSPSLTIDPIDLLKSDFNSNDYATTIHAPLKIVPVALSIGPERTRTELMTYIHDTLLQIENDEILTNIALVMQFSVPLIGGSTYIKDTPIVQIFERLCSEEEYIVREQACSSLNSVTPQLNKIDVNNLIIPMLKRLAIGEWFTTRVSATNLFHVNYTLVSDSIQNELRALYSTLCTDDTPMVRKKCYDNLHKFAAVLQPQYLQTDVYTVLDGIVADDLDSIRQYAIDCIAALTVFVPQSDIQTYIFPTLDKLAADQSWRIRMHLSNKFDAITQYLTINVNPQHSLKMIQLYSGLVRDAEPEVRNAAVKNLSRNCRNIKHHVTDQITAQLLNLIANDTVQQIRVSFSEIVVDLCPLFERDNTQKILLPIIQALTRDESYEVRFNVLKQVEPLCETIGSAGVVSQVLPYIIELSKDQKWRVRYSVISNCNYLTRILGEKIYLKRIQPILIAALNDHVYAIREIACVQIGSIIQQLGDVWAAEKLFGTIFTIFDTQINYLHRITCLMIIEQCIQYCSLDITDKYLFPIIYQASVDEVPNVKLSAAKTLIKFTEKYDTRLTTDKIVPLVDTLRNDTDSDVKYFAEKTYTVVQAKLSNSDINSLVQATQKIAL